MKNTNELTLKEFSNLQKKALLIPFSDYACFHLKLLGYRLFNKFGERIDRITAYNMGFRNVTDIIENRTELTYVKEKYERIEKDEKGNERLVIVW